MTSWQVDPILSCIGIGLLILTNIGIWLFAFGKRTGRHNAKMENVEKELDNPKILPECVRIFADIRQNLTRVTTEVKLVAEKVETNVEVRDKVMELSGKVEAMFMIMKENQKNEEKRKMRPGGSRRQKPKSG